MSDFTRYFAEDATTYPSPYGDMMMVEDHLAVIECIKEIVRTMDGPGGSGSYTKVVSREDVIERIDSRDKP